MAQVAQAVITMTVMTKFITTVAQVAQVGMPEIKAFSSPQM